jgi:hypothetical protein
MRIQTLSCPEVATHLDPMLVNLPRPKTMAGQMLHAREETRVRVLPECVRRDSPMPPRSLGNGSQLSHNSSKADRSYRSALGLGASPDVPARETAIVTRLSSVGWTADGDEIYKGFAPRIQTA